MKILKLVLVGYLPCTATLSATLFNEVTGLSAPAQSSLIAHYDGRTGVGTTGAAVDSWTPVDGSGALIPGMAVTSIQRGSGAPDLITYDGSDRLSFDDPTEGDDGRFLSGSLSNLSGTEFTVIWLGHYKSSAPFATSGTYAYNIGPNQISHQRDDFGGGFRVEMYNGTTYGGDDITAFDDTDTVWSTVTTSGSHNAYANGVNLNVDGTPVSIAANATINIGAFDISGYDFVGDISHLLIFQSSLSDADRQLIEGWLIGQVDPPNPPQSPDLNLSVNEGIAELTWTGSGNLLSSDNLQEWYVEPEATSPMTWSIERDQEFFKLVDTFSEVPKGVVFRTRLETYTWRDIEYHLDTGDLYLVGEQTHGLDFYNASGNDYWWCYMNSSISGSGLLEFLMDNNLDATAMKSAAISGGWTSYTGANYSFLTFEPLASQKTYVNSEAPSSPGGLETTEAYTDDYTSIPTGELHFTVYRNSSSGLAYFGLGGSSLEAVVSPSSPPGDGTANRDNGARYDIAFKTNVPLSNEKKLELLNSFAPVRPQYDDAAEPYYIVHPSGL
jgi:hypothetical protein